MRRLTVRDEEYLAISRDAVIWRVHLTRSAHPLPWNALRFYGPDSPSRATTHVDHAVWYGADDVPGSLAEAFQRTRLIDRAFESPYLTGFRFARDLRLLDLAGLGSGRWPVRVGGTFALDSAPHHASQQWDAAIHSAYPDLDGLIYRGRHSGGRCLALFPPAADAFPARPLTSEPLTHPGLYRRLMGAAHVLGYRLD